VTLNELHCSCASILNKDAAVSHKVYEKSDNTRKLAIVLTCAPMPQPC